MNAIARVDKVIKSLESHLDKENYDERLDDFISNTLHDLWDLRYIMDNENDKRNYDLGNEANMLRAVS